MFFFSILIISACLSLPIFSTFEISPIMIKLLCLKILLVDSNENQNAQVKVIIALDDCKLLKKLKQSVLRFNETTHCSVGSFVMCMYRHESISKE